MTACRGCGAKLPPNKGPGRQREWCSTRCRKQTLYGRECDGCGRKDNGSEGRRDGPYYCAECKHEQRYGEENRRIEELWNKGYTADQIASVLGNSLSPASIQSRVDMWRRRYGKPLVLHRRPTRHSWEELARLWNENAPVDEICDRLGMTKYGVWQMIQTMRKKGWDVPPRQRVTA